MGLQSKLQKNRPINNCNSNASPPVPKITLPLCALYRTDFFLWCMCGGVYLDLKNDGQKKTSPLRSVFLV